ncbi:terpene cyclase [Taiwanofungus camphoratus]|nr:terpene cyclase [Antrodia cinnamomea]
MSYVVDRMADESLLPPNVWMSLNINVTKAVSREAIHGFFDKIDFKCPGYKRDAELELQVKEVVQSWRNESLIRPHVVTALIGTITAYGHISSMDTKVQIALFTVLVLAMDDPAILGSIDSHQFHQRVCAGEAHRDTGMLGEFTRIISGMWTHYPPFSANLIFASALCFVNMSMLENESGSVELCSAALPFVQYRRSRSATAEAYACFIWEKAEFPDVHVYLQAIPDVMLFIGSVNDILSFYKEEIAGETGNYIHDRASITGKTASYTLREVVDETVAAVARIRSILGEGKARDAWEDFATGYISAHASIPRYRLQEVIGGQYIMDSASY